MSAAPDSAIRARAAIPGWRLAALAGGLGALWIAVVSPLARLHHASLTIHMAQHLLIMCAAAPLLLIATAALVSRLDGTAHSVCARLRGVRLRGRVGRAITHPAVCWLAGTGVVIGWHVPDAFALALGSRGWHAAQQVSFFAAGLLFWWPVVQPWATSARLPPWWIPGYLFAATLPCDALSAFLVFCDRVIYAPYSSPHAGPGLFQMSPMADQACAGALMWVAVTLIYLCPAVTATVAWLSPTGDAQPDACRLTPDS